MVAETYIWISCYHPILLWIRLSFSIQTYSVEILNLMLQFVELKNCYSLCGWLAETWIKRWLTVNELEMPDLPWFTVD